MYTALGGDHVGGDVTREQIERFGEMLAIQEKLKNARAAEHQDLEAKGAARSAADEVRLAKLRQMLAGLGPQVADGFEQGNQEIYEFIRQLQEQFGITTEEAAQLAATISDINNAKTAEAQSLAMSQLAQEIFTATDGLKDADSETVSLYQSLLEAVREGLNFTRLDFSAGLQDATRVAGALTDELRQALEVKRGLAAGAATGNNPDFFDPRNESGNAGRVFRHRSVPKQNLPGYKPPRSKAGGGGSRAAVEKSFNDLLGQATGAMSGLELAIAAVNEKVAAGLLSTAEGQRAIDGAIHGAASSIGDLIPKLERAADKAGPEAAAKIEEMRKALKGLAGDLDKTARELSKTFSDSLGQSMTDFSTGASSAKDAFADFGNTVLNQISRIIAQRFTARFITPLVDSLLGFVPSIGGAAGAGGGGGGAAAPGIVARPGAFAGGAALAAIGAQARGGATPPGVAGGAGAASPVTINVTNSAAGVEASASERSVGNERIIEVLVEQVEAGVAGNARRGVGPLVGVLSQTYGLGRVGQ